MRHWVATLAAAGLAAAPLAACGGGGGDVTPEKLALKLDAACTKAAEKIDALEAPTDAATFEAYQGAYSGATGSLYSVAADLDIDLEVPAADLLWFRGAVGQFKSLIGAWTPQALAWQSLAIARVATEAGAALGTTTCGPDTWEPQRWTDYLAADGHRQSEAEFRTALDEVCRTTLGSFSSSGEPGDLGRVIIGTNASRAITDFTREASFLDPPAELAGLFVDLLEPLVSVEALVPDVAVNVTPERRQRIEDQGPTVDAALTALEVSCSA